MCDGRCNNAKRNAGKCAMVCQSVHACAFLSECGRSIGLPTHCLECCRVRLGYGNTIYKMHLLKSVTAKYTLTKRLSIEVLIRLRLTKSNKGVC